VNTPRDDMPEHDPAISDLYRKTGDIAPPASLDEAVLASARRATRQRRQRWILPLSTAAVLMLGITVLLKLNSEWQPRDSAPVSAPHEEKSEITESLGSSADTTSMSDSTVMQADKLKEGESPVEPGMLQAEQKALEPKPWIEKIHKLIEEKKLDEAKKELEAFRKHYPDYKLPNDLKSLLP